MPDWSRAVLGLAVAVVACRPVADPSPPNALPSTVAEPEETSLPGGLVLVADKSSAQLHVVSLSDQREVAVLPTGVGPHEVAVSHDGRTAVVSNYGDQTQEGHTLTVVDLDALEVVRTIDLGEHARPHGAHFRAGSTAVVVTSEVSQHVVEVDVASGSVIRATPTEQPASHMVALHGDGTRAFTANIVAGTVSELDLERGVFVRSIPVAPMVEAIAVQPGADALWVGSNAAHSVSIIDLASGTIEARIDAPGVPIRIAFTPSGQRALVSAAQASAVYIFDPADRSRVASVELEGGPPVVGPGQLPGAVPVGIAVIDEHTALVSLAAAGEVAVIDIDEGKELARMAAGVHPDGIGFAPRPG